MMDRWSSKDLGRVRYLVPLAIVLVLSASQYQQRR